jgi:hypothetical protein
MQKLLSDGVNIVSEGEAVYQTKARKNKDLKGEYYKSKK